MNRDEVNVAIDTLKEHMGNEAFLDELLTALDIDLLNEYLEHVAQMWDIDIS